MSTRFLILLLSSLVSLGSVVRAGPREDVQAGSARCGSIADDRLYLDCYYGAAQPLRDELHLPPAPAAQVQLVPPIGSAMPREAALRPPKQASAAPPMDHDDSPGFLGSIFGNDKPLVAQMPMKSYAFAPDGAFIVTLEDGEIWRQSRNPSARANWKAPAPSYLVTIEQGPLGTENMSIKGVRELYKVHRVR